MTPEARFVIESLVGWRNASWSFPSGPNAAPTYCVEPFDTDIAGPHVVNAGGVVACAIFGCPQVSGLPPSELSSVAAIAVPAVGCVAIDTHAPIVLPPSCRTADGAPHVTPSSDAMYQTVPASGAWLTEATTRGFNPSNASQTPASSDCVPFISTA